MSNDGLLLETPALVLNEEKLINNLQRMMRVSKKNNVNVRPHFKTHKSVYIAKLQLSYGACGITVATTSEAELLLENGVKDILVAFPLTDPTRIRRLLKWSQKARVIFTIDSEEQAKFIEEEAVKEKIEPEVWIKINSGLNRCGTEPGEEAYLLAKKLDANGIVKLTGLFTHAGHSYAAKSPAELDLIARKEAESILSSTRMIEEAGISIPHRSVGSTPTFERTAQFEGITEVRPGNAVFFDAMQVDLGVATWDEVALTVLATVVSRKKDRLIIDAGSKALTTEKGAHGNESIKGNGKLVLNSGNEGEELYVSRVSEEHGVVTLDQINESLDNVNDYLDRVCLSLNERVHIIPNHACPVVNLFDFYHFLRKDGTMETIPVDARGKSQ